MTSSASGTAALMVCRIFPRIGCASGAEAAMYSSMLAGGALRVSMWSPLPVRITVARPKRSGPRLPPARVRWTRAGWCHVRSCVQCSRPGTEVGFLLDSGEVCPPPYPTSNSTARSAASATRRPLPRENSLTPHSSPLTPHSSPHPPHPVALPRSRCNLKAPLLPLHSSHPPAGAPHDGDGTRREAPPPSPPPPPRPDPHTRGPDPAEKKPRRRRKTKAPEPRGLTARQMSAGAPPAPIMRLMESIEADGGTVIGPYREPLGGLWQVIAGLPVEKVEPTPYQTDLSQPQ